MTISADGKVGNGVHLFDPETTVLRVLDSSATTYTGLSWRRNAPDLAVLRAQTDDRHDGPTHAILAWTGVGSAGQLRTYDPSTDATFPAGMRTVSFRRLSWSDDGKTIFLGYRELGRQAAPTRAVAARLGDRGRRAAARAATASNADEPAGVDIWHWMDPVVHGATEAERDAGSPPESPRDLESRLEQARADRQVLHGDGHADPAHQHGARRPSGRPSRWIGRSAVPRRISTSPTSRPARARSSRTTSTTASRR